jgi:hypothetical protein
MGGDGGDGDPREANYRAIFQHARDAILFSTRSPRRSSTPIGMTASFETVRRRKDGTEVHLEASGVLIEVGGCQAILSILRDVSESETPRARARAGRLVRDLRSFSHKQVTKPTAVDVNGAIRTVARWLSRLLDDRIVVDLTLAADLPVVLMSGRVDQDPLRQLEGAEFVPKPFEPGDLTAALKRALGGRS